MKIEETNKLLLTTLLLILLIVGICLPVSYLWLKHTFPLSIMLVFVGATSFFGILMLPGSCSSPGIFDERRIRLAITASLFLVYISYFGTAVFWKDGKMGGVEEELFNSVTHLLAIILPFYFGSSVFSEYLKNRNPDSPKKNRKNELRNQIEKKKDGTK